MLDLIVVLDLDKKETTDLCARFLEVDGSDFLQLESDHCWQEVFPWSFVFLLGFLLGIFPV